MEIEFNKKKLMTFDEYMANMSGNSEVTPMANPHMDATPEAPIAPVQPMEEPIVPQEEEPMAPHMEQPAVEPSQDEEGLQMLDEPTAQ